MNIKNPCSPVLTRLHRHCEAKIQMLKTVFGSSFRSLIKNLFTLSTPKIHRVTG